MRIIVDNKEIIINNIILKNDKIHITNNGYYSLIPHFKLNYTELKILLKESLNNYVDLDSNENINNIVETYFNYFKITSNELIKNNMSSKIGNILLNNVNLVQDDLIKNIISNHKSIKCDKYYSYLFILLSLSSVKNCSQNNTLNFEDENFSYLDFIFDYNLE